MHGPQVSCELEHHVMVSSILYKYRGVLRARDLLLKRRSYGWVKG